MSWMKLVFTEFLGLFVDNQRFALSILVWIGVTWIAAAQLPAAVAAIGFAAGLLAILTESAVRQARGR